MEQSLKSRTSSQRRSSGSQRPSPRAQSAPRDHQKKITADRGRPVVKKYASASHVSSTKVDKKSELLDDNVKALIQAMIKEGVSALLNSIIGDAVSAKTQEFSFLIKELSKRIEVLESGEPQIKRNGSVSSRLFPSVILNEDSASSPVHAADMEELVSHKVPEQNTQSTRGRLESHTDTKKSIRARVLERMAPRGQSVERTVKKIASTWRSSSQERKIKRENNLNKKENVGEMKGTSLDDRALIHQPQPPISPTSPPKSVLIEDLAGKWEFQPKKKNQPSIMWNVSKGGVAESCTDQVLHFNEELQVQSPMKGTVGGWLIMRGDSDWKLDASRSNVSVGRIVWRREIDRELEGGNLTFELEEWKRLGEPSIQSSSPSGKTLRPPPISTPPVTPPSAGPGGSPSSAKSPSAAASKGFMKVMKKGVLLKVLASQLTKAVVEVEPKLTELLTDIANKAEGKLVGLENKFKTQSSLLAKLDRDVHEANLKVLEDLEKRRRAHNEINSVQTLGEKKQLKLRRASLAVMQSKRKSTNQEQLAALMQSRNQSDLAAQQAADRLHRAFQEVEKQAEKEGKNEVDLHAIVWAVSDALRYTVVLKTNNYTESVRNAVERLKSMGMVSGSLKNYWGEGDGYQGINDVFLVPSQISPTGFVKVEIQFHTPESFEHKMAVHGMYEEFRSTRDPTRKVELWQESVAMADTIPVPKDVLSLPELRTQPMPIETTLYVDLVISRALKIQQPALDVVNQVLKKIELPDFMHDGNGAGRAVNAKVTSTLMSPSSVEMRIKNEMLHPNDKLRGSLMKLENENEIEEMKLKDAALRISDAVVIDVVFDMDCYATATEMTLSELFKQGTSSEFQEVKTSNGWIKPTLFKRTGPSGGVGIYSHVTMEGEDDGVAFTPDDAYPLVIAFHTPESLAARVKLQSAWSSYREANTSKQRNAATLKAQQLSAEVTAPVGARGIRGPRWLQQLAEGSSAANLDELSSDEESDDDEEAPPKTGVAI